MFNFIDIFQIGVFWWSLTSTDTCSLLFGDFAVFRCAHVTFQSLTAGASRLDVIDIFQGKIYQGVAFAELPREDLVCKLFHGIEESLKVHHSDICILRDSLI